MRYAMCPVCMKIVKVAENGDLFTCWHGIGVQAQELRSTSDKIMVAELVNDKTEYHECNDEDYDKMSSFIHRCNH